MLRPSSNPQRVYVAIRTDLPKRQQLVQSVHAAMEAAYLFPARDPWLVVLAVANDQELVALANHCTASGVRYALFHEPDDGLGITALACEPIASDHRGIFRKFRLWSPD